MLHAHTHTHPDRASKAPSTIQALFKNPIPLNKLQSSDKEVMNTESEQAPLMVEKGKPSVSTKERWIRWTSLVVFLSLSVPLLLAAILIVGIFAN